MRQIPITAALAAFFVFAVAVPANTGNGSGMRGYMRNCLR